MKYEIEIKAEQKQKMLASAELIQNLNVLQYSITQLDGYVRNELMENPVLEEAFSEYEDTYSGAAHVEGSSFQHAEEKVSLREYLALQVGLMEPDGLLRDEALKLIEYIDDSGFINDDFESDGISSRALDIIQNLEPYGVGARSINECFVIQLRMRNLYSEIKERIIYDSLEELVYGNYDKLAKKYGITEAEAEKLLEEIRQLNPRPGSEYDKKRTEYIIPDVFINWNEEKLQVRINSRFIPSLKLDEYYLNMLRQKNLDPENRAYLMEKVKRAEFLIEAIRKRNRTLLDMVRYVSDYQIEYFKKGEVALKPLTYSMVADGIGVHESTIYRSVVGKYVQTPLGTFAIKYFFPSGTKGNISSTAVKKMIGDLIKEEKKDRIYSDNDIVEHFSSEGIEISRRTVAKYREALGIPNSYERKKLKK